ncbi:MAG: adenine deaminase [Vallitaleaceae bacterium]|nr:adenine deaminase [Vallitaleaceae bacterium]
MKNTLKIVQVARGDKKADIVLKNCKILDVFNEAIEIGDIAIVEGIIVGIGSYSGDIEVDIEGDYVIPGLIDAHVHIESSFLTPPQFAKLVVPRGTTTVIADPHEIANVCGSMGIEYMINSSKELPIDVYVMLPSCVPSTEYEHSGAVLSADALSKLKGKECVIGLGEMMNYPGVVKGNKDIHDKLQLFSDGMIDGHSPNLSGKDLNAYIASGVRTDHECSNLGEMAERIKKGMYVLIREGSATRNLSTLVKGVTKENAHRIAFCTDDKQPEDIMKDGHINYNVNRSIELGLDPITAIKMATLTPATCYRMYDRGAIAPGFIADLVVTKSLELIEPLKVYKKGELVAKDKTCLVEVPFYEDLALTKTVNIKDVSQLDLSLKLKSDIVRVIKLVEDNIITEEVTRKVDLEDGYFKCNTNLDILKLAVIERHHQTGFVGIGLVEGYGLRTGAIGLTIAHDSHNVIVIGTNDADMKLCAETLEDCSGGIVIIDRGEVQGVLPLEIGGLMTNRTCESIVEHLHELSALARLFGVREAVEPFLTLAFLALPVIPELKLTDQGLFDVTTFQVVDINK